MQHKRASESILEMCQWRHYMGYFPPGNLYYLDREIEYQKRELADVKAKLRIKRVNLLLITQLGSIAVFLGIG